MGQSNIECDIARREFDVARENANEQFRVIEVVDLPFVEGSSRSRRLPQY